MSTTSPAFVAHSSYGLKMSVAYVSLSLSVTAAACDTVGNEVFDAAAVRVTHCADATHVDSVCLESASTVDYRMNRVLSL